MADIFDTLDTENRKKDIFDELSLPPTPIPQPEQLPPETIGWGAELGRAAVRSGANVSEMLGNVLRTIGITEPGEIITHEARQTQKEYAPGKQYQESFLGRGVLGGVESLGPSLAAGIPGAIIGQAAIPVPVLGGLIGYALGAFGMFTANEYQNYLDEYRKTFGAEPGDETKARAALSGLIEGGFEGISDLIGGGFLLKGVKRAGVLTIKELLKTPMKQAAVKFAETATVETGTEVTQNALEAYLRQIEGLPTESPARAAVESIIPALTMTGLFNLGHAGIKRVQAASIEKALTDPTMNPMDRMNAANYIDTVINESLPENERQAVSDAWKQYVVPKILTDNFDEQGRVAEPSPAWKPQPIDMDFMLDPLGAQADAMAADLSQKLYGDETVINPQQDNEPVKATAIVNKALDEQDMIRRDMMYDELSRINEAYQGMKRGEPTIMATGEGIAPPITATETTQGISPYEPKIKTMADVKAKLEEKKAPVIPEPPVKPTIALDDLPTLQTRTQETIKNIEERLQSYEQMGADTGISAIKEGVRKEHADRIAAQSVEETRAELAGLLTEPEAKPVLEKAGVGEGKQPWEMTREEYINNIQKGPKVREDYAAAWTPVKHPIGKPNTIEFTLYKNAKKAGVYRWNDKEGIGRGVLAVDDKGIITDLAVQKQYRRQGIGQELMDRAYADGNRGTPTEVTTEGAKATHRKETKQALSEGKPVPRNVLEEYKGEPWADEALKGEGTNEALQTFQAVKDNPTETNIDTLVKIARGYTSKTNVPIPKSQQTKGYGKTRTEITGWRNFAEAIGEVPGKPDPMWKEVFGVTSAKDFVEMVHKIPGVSTELDLTGFISEDELLAQEAQTQKEIDDETTRVLTEGIADEGTIGEIERIVQEEISTATDEEVVQEVTGKKRLSVEELRAKLKPQKPIQDMLGETEQIFNLSEQRKEGEKLKGRILTKQEEEETLAAKKAEDELNKKNPLFLKQSDLPNVAISTKGSTVDQVNNHLASTLKKLTNIGNIKVVPNYQSVDVDVAERSGIAEAATKGEKLFGMYDPKTDTTYIFADAIANGKSAKEVLIHEIVGHRGITHLLPPTQRTSIHNALLNGYKGTDILNKIVSDYGLDLTKSEDKETAGKELIAHLAQTKDIPTLWDKVVRMIKVALTRLGIGNYKEADIDRLIRRSFEYAQKAPTGVTGEGRVSLEKKGIAPQWYSKMNRFLEGKLPNTGTSDSFKSLIQSWANKGEFKADELKWSGLIPWLESKKPASTVVVEQAKDGLWDVYDKVHGDIHKGALKTKEEAEAYFKGMNRVTKQDIIDYLNSEGKIEIKEVVKGGVTNQKEYDILKEKRDELIDIRTGGRHGYTSQYISVESFKRLGLEEDASYDDIAARIIEIQNQMADMEAKPTKFSAYQLPGGENYREMLFTLPAKEQKLNFRQWYEAQIKLGRYTTVFDALSDKAYDSMVEKWRWDTDIYKPPTYKSSHWTEPNILAHVRINDRTDAQGRKVLFIEEVQSDWGQQGREEGFTPKELTPNQSKRLAELREKAIEGIDEGKTVYEMMTAAEKDEYERLAEIQDRINEGGGVTEAPFVGRTEDWMGLVMKRMLRYAAENGYDSIAWTTGEQQNERYDLSKHIDTVSYDPLNQRLIALKGRKWVIDEIIAPQKLEDYIGKDIAKKLLESPANGAGNHELSGLDLKIGGEGMKGFYDKIIPNFLNKYAKQWGAKTGQASIETEKITFFSSYPYIADAIRYAEDGLSLAYTNGDHDGIARMKTVVRELKGLYERSDGNPRVGTYEELVRNLQVGYTDVLGQYAPQLVFKEKNVQEIVHSLPITESMKDSVLYEGQPMFKKEEQPSFSKTTLSDFEQTQMAFDPKTFDFSKEGFKAIVDSLYTKFVYGQAPLIDFIREKAGDEAAEKAAQRLRKSFRYKSAIDEMLKGKGVVRYGFEDERESKFIEDSKSLTDILKPLKNHQMYIDYEAWRAARTFVALDEYRPDYKMPEGLADKARNEIARIETKYADQMDVLRQVDKDHRQFEQDAILKPLVDIGWMSQKAFDTIVNAPEAEYYSSLQRQMDEQIGSYFKGKEPVKRRTGTEEELKVIPSVESTISNLVKAMKIVETQKSNKHIVGLRELYPDLAEIMQEKKPKWMKGEHVVTKKELAEIAEKLGVDPEEISDVDKTTLDVYLRNPIPPKNTIVVGENGVKHYYTAPEDVRKALDIYSSKEVGTITKVLSWPAKWLRAGATTTFDFILRNPVRDQFTAMVYAKYGYTPFVDFAKGLFHVLDKTDLYHEARAMGLGENFTFSMDRIGINTEARDLLSYRGAKGLKILNPLQTLRYISGMAEIGTRMGVYARARKAGAAPLEAISETSEATTDFLRFGAEGRAISMITAFWNPNVQGVDLMRRKVFNKANAGQSLLRIGLGITLPSMILWAINHDDERYKELPGWQKDLFWIINVGKDKPLIRIPKPFELGILFGSLPERMLSFMFDRDPRGMKEVATSIKEGAMPGIIPTAVLPVLEWMTNYNFFTDRPLENATHQNLPPGMRVGPNTTGLSEKIGKLVDISPIKLDNMIQGWTGGLGKETAALISYIMKNETPEVEKKWYEQAPGLKGFLAREPIGSTSESVNNFYDIYAKTQQAEKGYKLLAKSGDSMGASKYYKGHKRDIAMAKSARLVAEQLSMLRKQVLVIQDNKTMGSGTKRIKIDMLKKRMTEITKNYDLVYNRQKGR